MADTERWSVDFALRGNESRGTVTINVDIVPPKYWESDYPEHIRAENEARKLLPKSYAYITRSAQRVRRMAA